MTIRKILIVEDEESLSLPLAFLLGNEGYQTEIAPDGPTALRLFSEFGPDIILLDVMLPGFSGIEVCKRIRVDSNVPIIMLTAKQDEIDKVVGLEVGADDYVTKPYSSRELLARIRAVTRRKEPKDLLTEEDKIVVGQLVLDSSRHEVKLNGKTITLPLKEFELLELLMINAGRVLTRQRILDQVWGLDKRGDMKSLDVHIMRLRSKLEADEKGTDYIKTIRGLGYKFEITTK